jgi:uncharacterized BrkB/YihY/UPF0761 family membrane protein
MRLNSAMDGASDPGVDERGDDADVTVTAVGRTSAMKERGRVIAERLQVRAEDLRERSRLVDVGVRVYDRDREAAGTLLGSALALRLFLFFVPFVLFMVGMAGLIGHYSGYDSFSSDTRLGGTIGEQIDAAFAQSSVSAWFILVASLFGMGSAGYSLSRAMIVSSALSWKLGGRQRTGVGVIGSVAGLIACIGLVGMIVNAIREATGVAVASVSFVAVFGVYVVLWILVFLALPRGTTDPGAALPGAVVAGLALTGMQVISTLYLPGAIERSSQLYGAIGVTLATLGWIYFLGRTIAFAFSLNAVIFEQFGSVSGLVFSVPGIRALPRRYSRLARYFDLDHQ